MMSCGMEDYPMSDIRRIIRENLMPSHTQIGCEGAREIVEDISIEGPKASADWGPMPSPGGGMGVPMDAPDIDPVEYVAESLDRLTSGQRGNGSDSEMLDFLQRVVDTGLIDYMNEAVQDIVIQLGMLDDLDLTNRVTEAEMNPAHTLPGDFGVKGHGPAKKRDRADNRRDIDPDNLASQKAHATTTIPTSGSAITSIGHKDFPASEGGSGDDPADIPPAAGNQKPGVQTADLPRTSGMTVGNSMYQRSDKDSETGDKYTGSKVGSVHDSMRGVIGRMLCERNLDGTGPEGEGPRTGRGAGRCPMPVDDGPDFDDEKAKKRRKRQPRGPIGRRGPRKNRNRKG